ncbi:C-type mannose receptor 2-like isoform X1 [Lytechinus pictus]|uniref:C-type mannose receptor 2-like isoform X1 n=1 Tax=Lytechinus pictus TaxID=7653 RepID=UPI0030BA1129
MLKFTAIAAFLTIFASCLPCLAYANGPSSCPEPWIEWEGFCYLLNDHPSTWQEAQALCISNGGGMVTLSSRRQLHFLSRLVEAVSPPATPITNLWLGCKRERNQPFWFCLDGKPLYDVWGDNEPHIDGSTSPAAVVLNAREGKMCDSNPVESYYSVCHKLIVPGSSSKSISLRFHRVFQNFILKGHSIHVTSHSYSIPACSALCLDTTECVSINIRADGTCELNSMDWRLGENGVVEREFGAQYYEPIYHT